MSQSLHNNAPIFVTVMHSNLNSSNNFKNRVSSFVVGVNGFNFLPPLKENKFGSNYPITIHPDTKSEDIFDSSRLFGYIAGKAEVPVIIDTGDSISLTPISTDFVGDI